MDVLFCCVCFRLFSAQDEFQPVCNHVGLDAVKASVIAPEARFVSVDAARPAVEVDLHGVVGVLSPSHESGQRVCGPPDAHHGCVDERGQVHVGRVHAQHDVEVAHQDQFLVEAPQRVGSVGAVFVFPRPFVHLQLLLAAPSEEEDAARGVLAYDAGNHLFRFFQGVDLSLVGREGSHANPLFESPLHPNAGRKEPQVAPQLFGEDGFELHLDGIAELCEHVGIVFKGGGLLFEHLVVGLCESFPSSAVLVDVCHLVLVQVEPHAQVFRSEHAVEVGHGGEVFRHEPSVERVEPRHPAVFPLDVGLHESHVGCQIFEHTPGEGLAEHGDAQMWILPCQRLHHGYGHGDVADGREPDDQNMFGFH